MSFSVVKYAYYDMSEVDARYKKEEIKTREVLGLSNLFKEIFGSNGLECFIPTAPLIPTIEELDVK